MVRLNRITFTYDMLGNPLTYDGWTYAWEHGRELASMSKNGTTWTYTYDANGMRTKRTNGTTTYTYVYNGNQLVQMSDGTNTLYFTYDANGHPMTVTLNGTLYYYSTNLQGDVVSIWNTSTNIYICDYHYDAWGNLIKTLSYLDDPIINLNPLLYRGYVYDRETNLYYLQSRYYNPEWGRFLNADVYVSTGQGLLGNNMFAYCNNNPVCFVDPTGHALMQICFDTSGASDMLRPGAWGGGGGGGGAAYAAGAAASAPSVNLKDLLDDAVDSVETVAEVCWEAYTQGCTIQQNAQIQEAQMTIDGVKNAYKLYKEIRKIDAVKVGSHAIKSANEGKKALAYLALPAPTPIDEIIAFYHMGKAFYHWFKCIKEGVQ